MKSCDKQPTEAPRQNMFGCSCSAPPAPGRHPRKLALATAASSAISLDNHAGGGNAHGAKPGGQALTLSCTGGAICAPLAGRQWAKRPCGEALTAEEDASRAARDATRQRIPSCARVACGWPPSGFGRCTCWRSSWNLWGLRHTRTRKTRLAERRPTPPPPPSITDANRCCKRS